MKLTISALILTSILVNSCFRPNNSSTPVKTALTVDLASEAHIQYTVIKHGKGGKLKPHAEILMHETISYLNGEQVFSTKTMGAPLAIRLGKGTIASKLENSFIGMQAGEVRKFIIPSALIKRRKLHPLFSPGSIVIYTIELVGSPFPKWFRGGMVRSLDPEEGC